MSDQQPHIKWSYQTRGRLGRTSPAVAPDGTVLVTDQALNVAYAFVPPKPGEVDEKGNALGPHDYQFKGTRFGQQGINKLESIAIDSRGRAYVVDAQLNDVRRFNPDFTPDTRWKFDRTKAGGDTHLHGSKGITIDEAANNLYIASEKDTVIAVFDRETGAYKRKIIGADLDASGRLANGCSLEQHRHSRDPQERDYTRTEGAPPRATSLRSRCEHGGPSTPR